jgi:hypothetical protein
MKKICKNAKNYKLTEGLEYEILKEENGYIFLINDSGKNVKYDASLFDEELEEEVVPARTEQDCIDSISYDGTRLSYKDLYNEQQLADVVLYRNYNNGFSCGIVRIEGLNDLCDIIECIVSNEEEDLIELKKALFAEVLNYHILKDELKGMWMCSTNRSGDNEDYHKLLNEISTHNSEWFTNPNSGNQIKLWYGIINQ